MQTKYNCNTQLPLNGVCYIENVEQAISNVDFSRYFAVIPGFEGYHHGKQYGIWETKILYHGYRIPII